MSLGRVFEGVACFFWRVLAVVLAGDVLGNDFGESRGGCLEVMSEVSLGVSSGQL